MFVIHERLVSTSYGRWYERGYFDARWVWVRVA